MAYAITYLFGTVGTGWILAFLGPKMLGVDIAAECARYEREMSRRRARVRLHERAAQARAARLPASRRAARRPAGPWPQAEQTLLPASGSSSRASAAASAIVPSTLETVLKAGDVVAIAGRREVLVNVLGEGVEVDDAELLDMPVEAVDVLITNKALDGRTLAEAAEQPYARGVFLNSIRRGSAAVNIPVLPQTKLNRGDILRVAGTKASIDRFVAAAGFADRPVTVTNMTLVGFAILIGGLIGAYVVPDRRRADHARPPRAAR